MPIMVRSYTEFNSIEYPRFDIGSFLELLDILPLYSLNNFITEGGIKNLGKSSYNTWKNDSYSGFESPKAEVIACDMARRLRANKMYCCGDRAIMDDFMGGILRDIILNDKTLGSFRSTLISLADYPALRMPTEPSTRREGTSESETNGAPYLVDSYENRYYDESLRSMIKFLLEKGGRDNTSDFIDFNQFKKALKGFYGEYLGKKYGKVSALRKSSQEQLPDVTADFAGFEEIKRKIFGNNKFIIEPKNAPAPETPTSITKDEEEKIKKTMRTSANQATTNKAINAIIDALTNKAIYELNRSKKRNSDDLRKPVDDRDNTLERKTTIQYSLAGEEDYHIYLPYKEILRHDTVSLTFDKFVFPEKEDARIDREMVSIPDEFDFIRKNLFLLCVLMKAGSAPYRPFSYEKLHVSSLKTQIRELQINGISPGDESSFKIVADVSPIDYFDHLIVRNYLNGVYEGFPGHDNEKREELRKKYLSVDIPDGYEFNAGKMFFLMAGCGVWILSKDNFLMFSRRAKVLEKPGNIGYSAAGSCEYTSRLEHGARSGELEANPFLTAKREILEECGLKIDLEKLELVSFGIDYERYLEEFSFFYYASDEAKVLVNSAQGALSQNEQQLFALPFDKDMINMAITNYSIEPGAAVSLLKIWRMRCDGVI
ncbi:MAG: hypothetical protein LBU13_09525 [Synergistaceae bacterium]|jgi:hypothetical protein|nr:hypothetical protein [Synergistaceae bacterium]